MPADLSNGQSTLYGELSDSKEPANLLPLLLLVASAPAARPKHCQACEEACIRCKDDALSSECR